VRAQYVSETAQRSARPGAGSDTPEFNALLLLSLAGVESLDLGYTLVGDWRTVAAVARELPGLASLDIRCVATHCLAACSGSCAGP
jgi:hypothetical protein